jgi:hypothetical protein
MVEGNKDDNRHMEVQRDNAAHTHDDDNMNGGDSDGAR